MIRTDTIAWPSTQTATGDVLTPAKEHTTRTRSTSGVHCAIKTFARETSKMAVKTSTAIYRLYAPRAGRASELAGRCRLGYLYLSSR